MFLLLATLQALYAISPVDSCRNALELGAVSEEAILFAELAAREGGEGAILYARLLEVAGRFEEAADAYAAAASGALDGRTLRWLDDRHTGSVPVDTVLLLTAEVINGGGSGASDLTLVMPLPGSHPPYQEIRLLGGPFHEEDGLLVCRLPWLAPGERASLTVALQIRQTPYTYRPLPGSLGPLSLESVSGILGEIVIPDVFSGTGPCLDMAGELSGELTGLGLSASVEGGLVRRGDSLVFHAWTVLRAGVPGLPLDPLLFESDTLRAIGHCPCDVIPLWDLTRAGGHELSVFYPEQDADLSISLVASFSPLDPGSVLFRLLDAGYRIWE